MLNEFGIGKVYVVHAKHGFEHREKWVNELFQKYNIQFEYLSEENSPCSVEELLVRYFPENVRDILSNRVILCTLSHLLCYEQIVQNQISLALIFEDDPFFLKNFYKKIEHVTNEAKMLKKGFLISLENTSLEFPPRRIVKKGQYLYQAQYGRCAGAYLVDYSGAKAMLEHLKTQKCRKAIDTWHNIIIKQGVIDIYWSHPPLFEQASHNGKLNSQIQKIRSGNKRRIKWLAQKFYKMYILRWLR
jgi:glycosyl transferase family 25